LTASKIIDVTGETPVEMKGFVPARSVVIPGLYKKPAEIFRFHVL
jgi:2,3,4,5-tetrahydropyridine-2-carboxylate N-succinyltransferase